MGQLYTLYARTLSVGLGTQASLATDTVIACAKQQQQQQQ
jgi:hypothetical protein